MDDPTGYSFRSIVEKINEYLFIAAVTVFAVVETVMFNNIRTQTEEIENSVSNIINYVKKTVTKSKSSSVASTKKNKQSTTNLYRAMDYIE